MCKFLERLTFVLFLSLTCIASGQETFRDNFSSVSYANNDGSQNFSGNWVEVSDDNSPSNGRIRVSSNQLRFNNLDGRYIYRFVPLAGASAVTLTLDYDATSRGNEGLEVYIYNTDTAGFNLIATINTSNTGSISYNLTAAEIASNPAIAIYGVDNSWGGSETIFIDNVLFTANYNPTIQIDDVMVNEDAGTASFTATHTNANASGPFTVNFTTSDGTAVGGNDYTLTTGTLNFNGTAGDTETIVVPITDDGAFEASENFTVALTGSSDGSVDISDTATGTINDNDVLGNTPLALFEELDGYVDYVATGGTLRTEPNSGNVCAITTSSSNTLGSTIPGTATIERAYLYWAHSNATPDSQVTFEGNTVNADYMYTTTLTNRVFYGGVSDVTSIIQGITNPSTNTYDFSGLTIDNTGNYCSTATVLGGWTLFIFYSDASLPASTVNLYQGFNGESNSSSSFSLSGFFAIGATGSKTTVMSWEGDQNLSNNELLSVTTGLGTFTLAGDGDNDGITTNNPFNSTIFNNTVTPNVNNATTYGVDLDTYDVSPYIQPGESTVTTNVQSGQDFVIMNALVLKVPSNLITGTVFEDINYGGGIGRNRTTSSGIGVNGARVELYDATNSLIDNVNTNSSGVYRFGGMANGTYSVRVVNNTIRSSRGGASCTSCYPVQTFRTAYTIGSISEVTDEVGGADPSAEDAGQGTLAGAQSVAPVIISSEGVVGLDFGFNFNTIVNTNENGQGSLEQFIVNSNNLNETGLDIVANSIFDPAAGDDTSIFMIPSTGDPLGRTGDANFSSGYFDISISNGSPLSDITGDNTIIDGRTQTAYSGDTNSGTVGGGGTAVGVSATLLPSYELPEIQVHRNGGDVLRVNAAGVTIRNLAVYANNNAGIRIDGGSVSIVQNLLGVNALGVNSGNIDYGVENQSGNVTVDGNYIATNTDNGIRIDGGTSNIIQNNHITDNGDAACDDNILFTGGSGIIIQQNLIESAVSAGIDASSIGGSALITENSITASGQGGGNCAGSFDGMGIKIAGNNSQMTNNVIFSNGGAGIVVTGGTGNLISQNSVYANGTTFNALGIDLDFDDVTLNDNGDVDTGPNDLLNFPIISAAYISGNTIVVKGWSRPGTTLEFFFTDINEGSATAGDNQLGLSADYGEGQRFIAAVVEGSGSDGDATASAYNDIDGNIDNTNRFEFSLPLPVGTALGDSITATATLGNSTSEFSPMSVLKVATVITNRRITYRANPN